MLKNNKTRILKKVLELILGIFKFFITGCNKVILNEKNLYFRKYFKLELPIAEMVYIKILRQEGMEKAWQLE